MAKRKYTRKKVNHLDNFKAVFRKWFVLYDDGHIDILFGAYHANIHLDSKPICLYHVGPPSSGKTEVLQAWDGHEDVYLLSSMTPNTLISGMIHEGDNDPSLIPKLDGKVLVIKDFTVLLKERHEIASAILSQLRDAFDGSIRKCFGTGKDKQYKSKFGVIAAVTHEIDKHVGKLSALGERFLICRVPQATKEEKRERSEKITVGIDVSRMEAEVKTAAHKVLNLKPKDIPVLPAHHQSKILDIAEFIALARTTVERDREERGVKMLPEPEYPTRISKQLCDLSLGIAIAKQKSKVTTSEIRLVQKVAVDCIPSNRLVLLKKLAELYPKKVSITAVSKLLRIGYGRTRIWLDDLYALDIADKYPLNGKYESRNQQYRLKKEHARLLRSIWLD